MSESLNDVHRKFFHDQLFKYRPVENLELLDGIIDEADHQEVDFRSFDAALSYYYSAEDGLVPVHHIHFNPEDVVPRGRRIYRPPSAPSKSSSCKPTPTSSRSRTMLASMTTRPPQDKMLSDRFDSGYKSGFSCDSLVSNSATKFKEKPAKDITDSGIKKNIPAELNCKVCLDEVVRVVFLPCSHLITCLSCSSAIVDCPLCRQKIEARVEARM